LRLGRQKVGVIHKAPRAEHVRQACSLAAAMGKGLHHVIR
jgi:hypothetical protein